MPMSSIGDTKKTRTLNSLIASKFQNPTLLHHSSHKLKLRQTLKLWVSILYSPWITSFCKNIRHLYSPNHSTNLTLGEQTKTGRGGNEKLFQVTPVICYRQELHVLARQMDSTWWQAGRVDLVVHQKDQEDSSAWPTGKWNNSENANMKKLSSQHIIFIRDPQNSENAR